MIRIDGSRGEGGGQILRSSLALSMVTGQPFAIDGIRAGREKPGLLRQHLTAVRAAAEVCGAEVEGAEIGSRALTFRPRAVRGGEYHFAVGTAGSATLVVQTILPALLTADAASRVTVEGGTHNSGAPPYEFFERTFAPLIARMGPRLTMRLEKYGFYPAGGGRIVVEIEPVQALSPLHLSERGPLTHRAITAVVANLPFHIAQREIETASALLDWPSDVCRPLGTKNSTGNGNVVLIEVGDGTVTEVFTAFGQRGVSAEQVAESAANEALAYLASTASAGEHLADQLLLPMALAGGGSFTSQKLNLHATTNMETIAAFLPVRFAVEKREGCVRVAVQEA